MVAESSSRSGGLIKSSSRAATISGSSHWSRMWSHSSHRCLDPAQSPSDCVCRRLTVSFPRLFTAPGGQPYWFNPMTNVSTYTRPLPPPPPGFPIAGAVPPPPPAGFPIAQHQPPSQFAPPLHFSAPAQDLSTAAAPTAAAPKKEKKEKPKEKLPIDGTSWIRVTTNKGNVFYNNKDTKESVWTVPEEIKEQIEELEKREKEQVEQDAKNLGDEEREQSTQRKRKAEDEGVRPGEDERETERKDEEEEDDDETNPRENGKLDIEIEGAEGAAPSAVPTETKPTPTPAAPSVTANGDDPPKKKKAKTKVVSSIEELETEEDWQRQVAEQMAKEAEEAEERERKEMEDAMKPDVAPEAEKVEKLEVNQIEAAAMYKVCDYRSLRGTRLLGRSKQHESQVLLAEKDINPMAPFENELPKFVNDPRYHGALSRFSLHPLELRLTRLLTSSDSRQESARSSRRVRRVLQRTDSRATSCES